jgi:hypothetical protein
MSKERKDPLAKVDDGKRDFLKKMAIGTAYAVPVMTTFSLDGVRNTALAQGTYGPPEVTDLQGGANRLEITFSRPMDHSSTSGSSVNAKADCSWVSEFPPLSCTGSWKWTGPDKREFTFEDCCFEPGEFKVLINWYQPCLNPLLGADGQVCKTFSGGAMVFGNNCS